MKDPAFLFYYRDWKSSTEKMTNAERGAYIQLICLQAENGHVTDIDMKKICSNICFDTMSIKIDESTYNTVKSKFAETAPGSGMYINARLYDEIQKRIKYSESRRNNRKNKTEQTYDNTHEQTYELHMVNVNVNENINEDKINTQEEKKAETKKEILVPRPSSVEEVAEYFKTNPECMLNGKSESEAKVFVDHFVGNGWKVSGKAPMKDWKSAARNWARRVKNGDFVQKVSGQNLSKRPTSMIPDQNQFK